MSNNLTFVCSQDVGAWPSACSVPRGWYSKDAPWGSPTLSESIDARLQSARAELVGPINRIAEAHWEEINGRRLNLIDRDIEHGLSAAEKAELDELEKVAEDYVNRVAPLPFGMLEKLKECAAKDGFIISLD
jgi:hypothetical protein